MSVERAKSLRKQMTDAERRLWYRLRAHRFHGLKFKRQVPIGHYVVDFANLRAKLVIEVDGGQHADRHADKIRTLYLNGRGFRVLRFWNNDVLRSTDDVLHMISEAVEIVRQTPSPGSSLRSEPPSPRWGEGS
jgi:very-short-patch-repair endonuclease